MMNPNNDSATMQGSRSDHGSRWAIGALVFLAIVFFGVASRFWLVDMPNFKPLAALILFGGFYFKRVWPAIAALMVVMVLSDLKLGVYQWTLMAAVYGSLALACWLGVWVKRSAESSAGSEGTRRFGLNLAWRFTAASLAMSTAFYLLTNGAVWLVSQWYAGTWSGLLDCYIAGLPFYRATLMGDLVFTGLIVGVYALSRELVFRRVHSGSSSKLVFNVRTD